MKEIHGFLQRQAYGCVRECTSSFLDNNSRPYVDKQSLLHYTVIHYIVTITADSGLTKESNFITLQCNILHIFWVVTITSEGLDILTYAWHSCPLCSEAQRSSTCHTYCLYNGHLQGPMTLTRTCCRVFGSGTVTTCLNLGLFRPGIEPQSPALEVNPLPLSHRRITNDNVHCNNNIWLRILKNSNFSQNSYSHLNNRPTGHIAHLRIRRGFSDERCVGLLFKCEYEFCEEFEV